MSFILDILTTQSLHKGIRLNIMVLLQKYFRGQSLSPLVLTLSSLTMLAILTQSLSTLDLIVENRQSAATFFYITALAIPQLIAIILPLAVFIAVIYSINRLNTDSELVVAKAAGSSPWNISSPIIRLAIFAAILHLLINIAVQPYAFRQMRTELLKVKTDLASQVIRAGEFNTPSHGLTIYSRTVSPGGALEDVIIHDSRDPELTQTYASKTGQISKTDTTARLNLYNGNIQEIVDGGALDLILFETYSIDLSDIVSFDTVLRLKKSDRYVHELLAPNRRDFTSEKVRNAHIAEGHSRLASPLYSIMLAFIALAFLVRGRLQRVGYGRKIALCAAVGFSGRLIGFAIESSAESNVGLNLMQYVVPLIVIIACLLFLLYPQRMKAIKWRGANNKTNAAFDSHVSAIEPQTS